MKQKKAAKRISAGSAGDKKRLIGMLSVYLFQMGMTQTEAAKFLEIPLSTVNYWVKRLEWQDKLKGQRRIEMAAQLKNIDNVPGFVAFVKKKHPKHYEAVNSLYQEFIKKY